MRYRSPCHAGLPPVCCKTFPAAAAAPATFLTQLHIVGTLSASLSSLLLPYPTLPHPVLATLKVKEGVGQEKCQDEGILTDCVEMSRL